MSLNRLTKTACGLLLFCLGSIFGNGEARAQAARNTRSVLDAFAGKVRGMEAVEVGMEMNGQAGVLYLQGQMFRLISEEFEVFCDGKDKWTYNKKVQEVVLVPNDTTVTDIMENPLAFFTRRSKEYRYPAHPTVLSRDGRKFWKIVLSPVSKTASYQEMVLLLDQGNLSPAGLDCHLSDNSRFEVKITAFVPGEVRPVSFFRFSSEEHPEAYMVDLR